MSGLSEVDCSIYMYIYIALKPFVWQNKESQTQAKLAIHHNFLLWVWQCDDGPLPQLASNSYMNGCIPVVGDTQLNFDKECTCLTSRLPVSSAPISVVANNEDYLMAPIYVITSPHS